MQDRWIEEHARLTLLYCDAYREVHVERKRDIVKEMCAVRDRTLDRSIGQMDCTFWCAAWNTAAHSMFRFVDGLRHPSKWTEYLATGYCVHMSLLQIAWSTAHARNLPRFAEEMLTQTWKNYVCALEVCIRAVISGDPDARTAKWKVHSAASEAQKELNRERAEIFAPIER